MARTTLTEQAVQDLDRIDQDQVQEGDIVFFSDGGTFQELLWLVNDPWMHAGIAVEIDGTISTVEAGTGDTIFTRPLAVTTAGYKTMAIGRPTGLGTQCVDQAVAWARGKVNSKQLYAWEDFILSGVLLTGRRFLSGSVLAKLGEVLEQMAEVAKDPEAASQSMTCSAFVHQAFNHRGPPCLLPVEFVAPPGFEDEDDQVAVGGAPARRRRSGPGLDAAGLDGAGRSAAGSNIGLSDVLAMNQADQDDVLAATTLMELVTADDRKRASPTGGRPGPPIAGTRSMHGSTASFSQLLSAAKAITELTARYLTSDPMVDGSRLQGRWVSPSDLWRCDQLGYRAALATTATGD